MDYCPILRDCESLEALAAFYSEIIFRIRLDIGDAFLELMGSQFFLLPLMIHYLMVVLMVVLRFGFVPDERDASVT